MSLTRKEWEEMCEAVKGIERDSDYLYFHNATDYATVARRILHRVKKIKTLIQQVVGQME